MPPRPSGKVLLRPFAESFSILDVAAEGLLKQGEKAAGYVGARSGWDDDFAGFVPISSLIGERDGVLVLHAPWRVEVSVEARVVCNSRGGEKLVWKFHCPGVAGPAVADAVLSTGRQRITRRRGYADVAGT